MKERAALNGAARCALVSVVCRGVYGAQMWGHRQGRPGRAQCQPFQPQDEAPVSAAPAADFRPFGHLGVRAGTVLAVGGGWQSSPTGAGGYCTAPAACAFAVPKPISRADPATSNAPRADLLIAPMLLT